MTDADKRLADTACESEELRAKESEADRLGDRDGDPQRGGRLPTAEADTGHGPRPADESARAGIPSRSFDL